MLIDITRALEKAKSLKIYKVNEELLKKYVEYAIAKMNSMDDPYLDGVLDYVYDNKYTDPYVFASKLFPKDIRVQEISKNLFRNGFIGEKLSAAISGECFSYLFAEILRCLIYQENEKLFTGEDTDIIKHLNNALKNAESVKGRKCDFRDALEIDIKFPMLTVKKLFGDEDYLRFNPLDPETIKRKPAGYYDKNLIILQCPLAPEEIKCKKIYNSYMCRCVRGCWTEGSTTYEAIHKFNNSIVKGWMEVC